MEALLLIPVVMVVGLFAATLMWSLRAERQPRRPPVALLAAVTAMDVAVLVANAVMANWLLAVAFGIQAICFGAMLVQGVRARRSA